MNAMNKRGAEAALATPPVLIIGAGPVGLVTACELLRHGVPCRLIDASDGPTRWSKASVLHARTLEIFAAMGIIEPALARGRRLHSLRVFHRGAALAPLLHVSTDGLDTPYPFLLGLSQRDTEQILLAHLLGLGGQVERHVRLQTLTQDEEGVTAGLSGADGDMEARARFVIACDGSYSMSRHLLGLPFNGHIDEEVYLQADVRMRWPTPFKEDEVQAFFSDAGALVAMPTQEPGCYRLQAPVLAVSDIEPSLATFRRLLAERGPAGAEIDELDWSVVFPVGKRLMPSFRAGRVFFAGDAAHQQSPASAQGMNLGIQDAHNLAWKLALCVRGLAQPLLLDSYDAERRATAQACQEVAEQAARSFAPALTLRSAVGREVREALVGFLSHMAGFRERFVRSLAMLDTRYAESAVLPEALGSLGGGPAPGERAPEVELPGSGAPLSSRLRGARHLLLLFSGDVASQPALPFLRRLALDVRSAYPESVDTLLVLQRPVDAVGPEEVLDLEGVVHQRFGARADAWILLRPDHYVAFRAQPAEEQALFSYLQQVLGAPALERSAL